MIKRCVILLLVALPVATQAEIVNCPRNGRPYDTDHGYYVDDSNSPYYVSPGDRAPAQKGSTTFAVPAQVFY